MNPLEKMSDNELINTTQDETLDYDIRIHASKEYLKRMGVIGDGEASGLHESDGQRV